MNKYKLLIAVALISVATASADISTPYSMYGYGIIGDRATSMQQQMGGVGYAMNSGRQINVMNPASYAAVDSMTFLFDLGADVSLIWRKEDDTRHKSTGGGVDYLTMQFPISKFMGGSIGLIPYSSVGYAFGNEIEHGAVENQGTGGINQLYLGFGGKVGGFSLGFNVSYDFGNILNDVIAEPDDGSSSQTKYEHVMQIRDWNINIGAQYTARWNKFNKLVIGATYSPKKTMLGKTWITQQHLTLDATPDTLTYMNMKNNYYSPNSVGAGISYTFEKRYRLMVEADVTWQQWSKAKYSPLYTHNSKTGKDELAFEGMNFDDRTKFAVGAEFIPKLMGNYAEKITYRLGGYFVDDYLNINGNRVKEAGVTCGVGLPTPEGKTIVNIGFEWKKRWASPSPLISENYLNITLGVNFNEVWFWKRKLK